jgi:hypothetical protein
MHARAVAQRLTTHVQDLEDQREALPIWALRRRRDLTTRIETTRNDWFHQNANDQVNRAGRAVETANGFVEVDSVQRDADDRADRQYRHQQWLERSMRPSPNVVITPSGQLDRGGSFRRDAQDRHYTVKPPPPGYGRSL